VRKWYLSYKRTLMNYLGVLLDSCPTCVDKYWRRQYVALDTSGYVQAWHPECARQKAMSSSSWQTANRKRRTDGGESARTF
jgi:hypothetical protein